MENKTSKNQKSLFEGYDKDMPVQNEFLSKASIGSDLAVVNESLCLYD